MVADREPEVTESLVVKSTRLKHEIMKLAAVDAVVEERDLEQTGSVAVKYEVKKPHMTRSGASSSEATGTEGVEPSSEQIKLSRGEIKLGLVVHEALLLVCSCTDKL